MSILAIAAGVIVGVVVGAVGGIALINWLFLRSNPNWW